MLRYFAYSVRNFRLVPDFSDHRLNWEFWTTFAGKVKPLLQARPGHELPPANFWIMPPGTRYRWIAETGEVERAVFHFAYVPLELEQALRRRGFLGQTLGPADLAEVRAIATTLGAAYRQRERLSSLVFQCGALDLALIALRGETQLPASNMDTWAADRAERAVAWYRDHLREAPKFGRLATEMNISLSHLRRHFQSHFGQGPKAVCDKVRIECAAGLLTASTATLEEVAGQSGFRSATDFCRVFKKHYGYPPNVWRHTVGKFDPKLVPPNCGLRELDLQRLVGGTRFPMGALACRIQQTASSPGW